MSKTKSEQHPRERWPQEGKRERPWLYRNHKVALTFQPVTVLTVLVVMAAIVLTRGHYSREALYDIVEGGQEAGVNTSVEQPAGGAGHAAHDGGAFVLRRIYMDQFVEEFDVEPIHLPEVEPDMELLIAKMDLGARLRDELEPPALQSLMTVSEIYAPRVEEIEAAVGGGTYVDDRRVYVRWVNDALQYGLFASRDIQAGEMIGIYAGVVSAHVSDAEYAWIYSYKVKVMDDGGKVVPALLDAMNKGNYLRFANHRDDYPNGHALYIVYKEGWRILYVAVRDIKAHEEIFVNYGEEYWRNKKKVSF